MRPRSPSSSPIAWGCLWAGSASSRWTRSPRRADVRGSPDRAVAIAELARLAWAPPLGGLPGGLEPGLDATVYFDPPGPTFSGAVHLAVVEVDRETGRGGARRSGPPAARSEPRSSRNGKAGHRDRARGDPQTHPRGRRDAGPLRR